VVTRVAGIAGRILRIFVLVTMVLIALAVEGLFFHTSDLPNIEDLSSFAPNGPKAVTDANICGKRATLVAIPTGHLTDLRNALLAAEGDVEPRNSLRRLYHDLFGDATTPKPYGTYSLQVASQLLCDDHGSVLKRRLAELRTSIQLERRFSTNQLLDIYLNRAYFGRGIYGIESASQHYLAKSAMQLSTAEAALLVGLIRSPDYLSPLFHPDRALARRNQVIEAMARRGSISPELAEQAKRMPLGTVGDDRVKPPS
jgi:membrane carboxypeptidase/penicillin-binding protein